MNNNEKLINDLKQQVEDLTNENIKLKLQIELDDKYIKKTRDFIRKIKERDEMVNKSMETLAKVKEEYDLLIKENRIINKDITNMKIRWEKLVEELSQAVDNISKK